MPPPVAPVAKALAPEHLHLTLRVVDYFELLGEPRRPWLDPEIVKSKFLKLSAQVHPDRVHGGSPKAKQQAQDAYTGLNTAYQALRTPKERLAHLLELEGHKPAAIQTAPGDLMDVFLEIGSVCRRADKFIQERGAVTSPLVRVSLFEQGEQIAEKLRTLQELVRQRSAAAEKGLIELNVSWISGVKDFGKLEQSYRTFSYLARWSEQLQERLVQLAL